MSDLVLVKINAPFGTVKNCKMHRLDKFWVQVRKNGNKAPDCPIQKLLNLENAERTQPTLNNSGFCPSSEKRQNSEGTVSDWTVCMQLCVYSGHGDVKQPVWMNSPPLSRAPLQNCSHVADLRLRNNVLRPRQVQQLVRQAAYVGEKRATLNATAHHTETFGCGKERSWDGSAMENGKKKSVIVRQVFQNESVCTDAEPCVPRMRKCSKLL